MFKVYFILGHFTTFLRRIRNFVLVSILIFLFHAWVSFFSMFCRFLNLFALTLTPIEYVLTPYRCPQATTHVEKKEEPGNFEIEPTTNAS